MARANARHNAARKKGRTAARTDAPARAAVRTEAVETGGSLPKRAGRILPLVALAALPVLIARDLWVELWRGARVRAFDGTGHYAIAQIYDRSIFPDTFGWTNAFFGGMPVPNFYPPLFYWCVALLHHTHLFPLNAAFKLLLASSVLLIPVAVWALAWALSGENRTAAYASALATLPLLLDDRFFHPIGLNNAGTFLIGLYTQPLGFVLLLAWCVVYLSTPRRGPRWVLASLLLALTVLANFFNAVTGALFVVVTVAFDLVRYYRARGGESGTQRRTALLFHLLTPLCAFCLVAFWSIPMLAQYDYFVTRPHVVALDELGPPAILVWYALAAAGVFFWRRRPTEGMWPFVITCSVLAALVAFAALVAPRWFPLQTPRFLSTLNFLLAVPVGQTLLAVYEAFSRALAGGGARDARRPGTAGGGGTGRGRVESPIAAGVSLGLVIGCAFLLIKPSNPALAFYPTESNERVDAMLSFAEQHRDGRYLVEVPHPAFPQASLDGRALNSFLGAQGNETLSVVFREASPEALFFNPLVNAFSAAPDSFGISSVLADDIDFVEQPFARHLERARLAGVKYLVIVSPWIKDRLDPEEAIEARTEFGDWTIFELKGRPAPRAGALPFKPALVVSRLSLKQRRRTDYNFVRWAEEQYADGWFDVLLAHSPESKLDKLEGLEGFGALIIDTYDCDDEGRAFALLREFARSRPLILLSSDEPLFRRLRAALSDFPHAAVIERPAEQNGEWIESIKPSFRYGSSAFRRIWGEVRLILEKDKTPLDGGRTAVFADDGRDDAMSISLSPSGGEGVPVLVSTTYHPNWRRSDGEPVYAATPFFMLTFVKDSADLTFGRRGTEKAALALSALTLLGLLCVALLQQKRLSSDGRK